MFTGPHGTRAKSAAPNDNVLDCPKVSLPETTRTSALKIGPDWESTTNTRNSAGAQVWPV